MSQVPIQYCAASARLTSSALREAFRNLWRLYKLSRAGRLHAAENQPLLPAS